MFKHMDVKVFLNFKRKIENDKKNNKSKENFSPTQSKYLRSSSRSLQSPKSLPEFLCFYAFLLTFVIVLIY